MNIGVPRERRPFEFRVGLTPAAVEMLVKDGHVCYVEHDAGVGAGFSDFEYEEAGAKLVYQPQEVFGRADLLTKVARPMYEELEWLLPNSTIMGLLHLASTRQDKINVLTKKSITAIPYEKIVLPDGTVPVRRPLSQIGGALVAQISANLLQNDSGGKGVLLGGGAGVPPAEVVIIGAGTLGYYAARAFNSLGVHMTVLDTSLDALQRIHEEFPSAVTLISNERNLARSVAYADVVVAAVLVGGDRPVRVVTREMVRGMKPRSLLMDVSIDEGGCVETSRPTTHEHPTYVEEGVIHYCVPNIPSVVARTSTYAFLNAAFPFIRVVANKGLDRAVAEHKELAQAALVYKGDPRNLLIVKSRKEGE
ncbi:MAG TPA: alanine dehydrogenase [Anaerolineales bacterium]|nr:alanine dehydrogenase [Anaerolineales bacterium]